MDPPQESPIPDSLPTTTNPPPPTQINAPPPVQQPTTDESQQQIQLVLQHSPPNPTSTTTPPPTATLTNTCPSGQRPPAGSQQEIHPLPTSINTSPQENAPPDLLQQPPADESQQESATLESPPSPVSASSSPSPINSPPPSPDEPQPGIHPFLAQQLPMWINFCCDCCYECWCGCCFTVGTLKALLQMCLWLGIIALVYFLGDLFLRHTKH